VCVTVRELVCICVCMYVRVFVCCMCVRYVIVSENLENQTQKPNNRVFNAAFDE
jgi:hypothetical protein